eukprot:TRINITY_DN32067_c0_g1_i1.p1 TRINITY_DN32067_c0_g1~~TRINITY_DN32067_c0_g1_i1.p1  ORF type:complete len:589 (+),score=87.56 TRINITY_DN32067_c0_g1_i1:63-1769(+)
MKTRVAWTPRSIRCVVAAPWLALNLITGCCADVVLEEGVLQHESTGESGVDGERKAGKSSLGRVFARRVISTTPLDSARVVVARIAAAPASRTSATNSRRLLEEGERVALVRLQKGSNENVEDVLIELPCPIIGILIFFAMFASSVAVYLEADLMLAVCFNASFALLVFYSCLLKGTGIWIMACGAHFIAGLLCLIAAGTLRAARNSEALPCTDCVNPHARGTFDWYKMELFFFVDRPESSKPAFGLACFILTMVMWSCIIFSAETMIEFSPQVHPQNKHFFEANEFWITVLFTAEYFLRLLTTPDVPGFLMDGMNFMDAASVLPFWVGPVFHVHISTGALRVVRILKIFRLLKLAKFSSTLAVIVESFQNSGDGLCLLLVFLSMNVFVISCFIWMIEEKDWNADLDCYTIINTNTCLPYQSVPDTFYYAVTTMTTVGYGDVCPATQRTRVVANFGMILGVLVIAMPVGILSSQFQNTYNSVSMEARIEEAEISGPTAESVVKRMVAIRAAAEDLINATKELIREELKEDPKNRTLFSYVIDGVKTDVHSNVDQVMELMRKIVPLRSD